MICLIYQHHRHPLLAMRTYLIRKVGNQDQDTWVANMHSTIKTIPQEIVKLWQDGLLCTSKDPRLRVIYFEAVNDMCDDDFNQGIHYLL